VWIACARDGRTALLLGTCSAPVIIVVRDEDKPQATLVVGQDMDTKGRLDCAKVVYYNALQL
jgi:hypothetical protein